MGKFFVKSPKTQRYIERYSTANVLRYKFKGISSDWIYESLKQRFPQLKREIVSKHGKRPWGFSPSHTLDKTRYAKYFAFENKRNANGVGAMRRRRLATLFGFRPRVALAVGSRTERIRETDTGGKETTNERTNERVRKEGWPKEREREVSNVGSLYHVPSVNTSPPPARRNYKTHVTPLTLLATTPLWCTTALYRSRLLAYQRPS